MGENVRGRIDSAREYSRVHRREPRRGRLRLVYFGLASAWGYAAGVGVVLAALSSSGAPVRWSAPLVGATVCGVGLAVLGGALAAGAYREAKRRARC